MELSNDLDQWAIKEPKVERNGWRVAEITDSGKLETHLQYVNSVVTELKALNIEKRPVSKIQAASTQRLLDMTDEELEVYRNRQMPSKDQWQRNADALQVFAEHKSDDQTRYAAESVRHNHGGNKIGEQVKATEINPVTQERAVNSFMETKADLSMLDKHLISNGHVHEFPQVEKKKRPLWLRILCGQWIWKEEEHRPVSWRDWNE